jgi:hypothetical protein
MGMRWLGIRVELIGGRGQVLDLSPGRSFAVPPGCTFDEFGRAIDLAFARWDLSHLRQFTLEDGTLVVDEEMADELRASVFGGTIPRTILLSAKLGRQLKAGSRFRYIFDLGDDWTHDCTVESYVDPLEVLGGIPDRPMAYWGWGMIPDQYGRRWDADDGVSEPPVRTVPEIDQLGWAAEPAAAPLIDRREFRRAVGSGKAAQVTEAISAVDIETALQQVGTGLLKTYQTAKPAEQASLSPVMVSVAQRLRHRYWKGDDILAAEMLAELRGEELTGRPLSIDLDELGSTMADRGDYPGGGYVNTQTGEVVPAALTDESTVGEEYVVDVEEGDWEHVVEDSHEGWQDMADFAAAVKDPRSRESLEDAVQGRGAFSRFRRAIDRADLSQEWNCFVDDRRWGRARQELADLGLRPV